VDLQWASAQVSSLGISSTSPCSDFSFPDHRSAQNYAVSAIHYFNSLTGTTETEQVYGESFLRYAYGNPLGKLALHTFIKRPLFSHWYGWRMNQAVSQNKIAPFITHYGLDPNEFAESPDHYKTFNEFFYRKLKPSARPIDADPNSIVFPADGRHLAFANAAEISSVFVKGQKFDLAALLGSPELAARYENGALLLSRLCPVDYHRFHFPAAGIPQTSKVINGPLFSVSPIALRQNLSYFWQNKRSITPLATPNCGTVLLLEIGATCVGSIHQTYRAGEPIAKGAEKGYFAFGGSSTILLFEPGRINIDAELLERSQHCTETYARMGTRFAQVV
jgi:phosphatidylserine decarboxylase